MNERIPLPIIYSHRCDGCGICVSRCPVSALASRDGKAVLANPDACTYCTLCEDACPEDAIALPFLVVFGEEKAPAA